MVVKKLTVICTRNYSGGIEKSIRVILIQDTSSTDPETAHTEQIAEQNAKVNMTSNNKSKVKAASIEIMGATGFACRVYTRL